MATIKRATFLADHAGQAISTKRLADAARTDPKLAKTLAAGGLKARDVVAADRNLDGLIDAKESWDLATKMGAAPEPVLGITPPTVRSDSKSARALGALDELMRKPELRPVPASGQPAVASASADAKHPLARQIDWSHPQIEPPGGVVTLPSERALTAGINAYNAAKKRGLVKNTKLTLVDYSLPATQPRLWIIDMAKGKLLAQHLVSHGKNSTSAADPRMATDFSDARGSNKTSLGTYIVNETYVGKFGYSARMRGLEKGLNGNASARAIRVHPWPQVDGATVAKYGNISTTEGCFGLNEDDSRAMINMMKGGSVLLSYSDNDPSFLATSKFIK